MKGRKAAYPAKRSMNLYYKPDRTTKPATAALYILFALTCLLGLAKLFVYDAAVETYQAERALAVEQARLEEALAELADYPEVQERYSLYSAAEEERETVDRMEVLALVDGALGGCDLQSVSISGSTVQLQFSGVTLAETAELVRRLEASPSRRGPGSTPPPPRTAARRRSRPAC